MSQLRIESRARLLRVVYRVGALLPRTIEHRWVNSRLAGWLMHLALEAPAVGVTYSYYDFGTGQRFTTYPPNASVGGPTVEKP